MPGLTTALDDLQYATLSNAHGRTANVPVEFDVNGAPALAINSSGGTVVSGDLSVRDIPGHEYFVSKYASIQAAINAAYGSGVVAGKVIDDRTSAYSGAGFYVPDSVTVELAPVPYTFTGTVTHNNGNNSVSAAIVVEQGGARYGAQHIEQSRDDDQRDAGICGRHHRDYERGHRDRHDGAMVALGID